LEGLAVGLLMTRRGNKSARPSQREGPLTRQKGWTRARETANKRLIDATRCTTQTGAYLAFLARAGKQDPRQNIATPLPDFAASDLFTRRQQFHAAANAVPDGSRLDLGHGTRGVMRLPAFRRAIPTSFSGRSHSAR